MCEITSSQRFMFDIDKKIFELKERLERDNQAFSFIKEQLEAVAECENKDRREGVLKNVVRYINEVVYNKYKKNKNEDDIISN